MAVASEVVSNFAPPEKLIAPVIIAPWACWQVIATKTATKAAKIDFDILFIGFCLCFEH
jgi:hypothetical protein